MGGGMSSAESMSSALRDLDMRQIRLEMERDALILIQARRVREIKRMYENDIVGKKDVLVAYTAGEIELKSLNAMIEQGNYTSTQLKTAQHLAESTSSMDAATNVLDKVLRDPRMSQAAVETSVANNQFAQAKLAGVASAIATTFEAITSAVNDEAKMLEAALGPESAHLIMPLAQSTPIAAGGGGGKPPLPVRQT
jgi:hypothetical protein